MSRSQISRLTPAARIWRLWCDRTEDRHACRANRADDYRVRTCIALHVRDRYYSLGMDAPMIQKPEHVSLWCWVNMSTKRDHHPCSGTCDIGHSTDGEFCDKPCECPMHVFCTCKLGLRSLVDCRGMECGICHRTITEETYKRGGVTFDESPVHMPLGRTLDAGD